MKEDYFHFCQAYTTHYSMVYLRWEHSFFASWLKNFAKRVKDENKSWREWMLLFAAENDFVVLARPLQFKFITM